jgi:RHH-type proline utilization regulon transcriptional repressor/proline dehydrogenase/delta 1-pyrroline-5-carboxylate dehydrogenase
MDELRVGNPSSLNTDVGPVIDTKAQKVLLDHIESLRHKARMMYQAKLQPECEDGIFVAPTVFEIGSIKELKREVFGPVIHIIRFAGEDLDKVIAEINSSGYGLTQGVHSRLEDTAAKVYNNIKAGNIYINRNTVGAVVGVQPFGGEGLSGTGPKAGGPLYLYRLVNTEALPKLDASKKEVDFRTLDRFVNSLGQLQLGQQDITELLAVSSKLKEHSPLADHIELPGPTGERNFMLFAPRGYVACVADSLRGYCEQIIHALATGNQVVMVKDGTNDVLARYLPKQSYFTSEFAKVDMLHALLISKGHPNLAKIRNELAKRDSLLTHVLEELPQGGYNIHLLVTERTVSNNITATGGNVQLMSIDDRVE